MKHKLLLFVAIAMDAALVVTLVLTLINPAKYHNFLFNGGVALLIGELIAVFMATTLSNRQRSFAGLGIALLVLMPWLLLMYLLTNNPMLVVMLVISFAAKMLLNYSVSDSSAGTKAVTFFISVSTLLIFGFIFERIAQPPAEVMQLAPVGTSGWLIEHPQVAPIWGIIHYSLGSLLEVMRAFKIGKVGRLLATIKS